MPAERPSGGKGMKQEAERDILQAQWQTEMVVKQL